MKTFIYSLFFLFAIANTGFSQTTDSLDELILVDEEEPEFPGGYPALMKFIYENIVYPQCVIEKIQGKVFLRFRINSSGKVDSVIVLKGLSNCEPCNQEAIRVVSNMPNWIPVEIDGVKSACWMAIPVNFVLE